MYITLNYTGNNGNICLQWSVQTNVLELKCVIQKLHFKVEILNSYGLLQGYCLSPYPTTYCHVVSTNMTLTQNVTLNETVLREHGNIDSKINGLWTFRHGTNMDESSVNITILNEKGKF